MRTEATHVICCPASPNDGKRVRIVADPGYNVREDVVDDSAWLTVEMVDTSMIGSIERRFVSEIA
ncbi:hypothetical protein WS89_31190 [Burkholderia sp. MSMB1072]|uniref:hypothetical protein n=1 Tax=Burkholderia sp. MSMB1072 TaxID=1637871 RepID=UPI00075BF0D8|nr:hypothetical protein [Burkholderia sp. MSMB1072]KVH52903.1 hypothetical protein WS89_31190 [Burkholderia sp. MSMB1072]